MRCGAGMAVDIRVLGEVRRSQHSHLQAARRPADWPGADAALGKWRMTECRRTWHTVSHVRQLQQPETSCHGHMPPASLQGRPQRGLKHTSSMSAVTPRMASSHWQPVHDHQVVIPAVAAAERPLRSAAHPRMDRPAAANPGLAKRFCTTAAPSRRTSHHGWRCTVTFSPQQQSLQLATQDRHAPQPPPPPNVSYVTVVFLRRCSRRCRSRRWQRSAAARRSTRLRVSYLGGGAPPCPLPPTDADGKWSTAILAAASGSGFAVCCYTCLQHGRRPTEADTVGCAGGASLLTHARLWLPSSVQMTPP